MAQATEIKATDLSTDVFIEEKVKERTKELAQKNDQIPQIDPERGSVPVPWEV